MMTIHVLIADDHAIVRQGLRLLLEPHPEIDVVGEAADGAMALQLVRSLKPDVLLLDLLMPDMNGIEVLQRLGEIEHNTQVLVLSSSSDDYLITEALKASASGYTLKVNRMADLVHAIERVAAGQSVLDPAAAQVVMKQVRIQDPLNTLTEREREVFDHLILGRKSSEIAELIGVGETTVRTHVANIIEKLGLRDRTHVVVYALKRGLVQLDDLL